MFDGFNEPLENWSKLPHKLIEALPLIDSLAEMKVILYILRHTWGYHDSEKRITNDEFKNGRKRRDGTRIDGGIGMSEPSIISGLRSAEDHGFIVVETDNSDKARIKKVYRLNDIQTQTLNSFTPEVKKPYPRGKKTLPRSKKETLNEKPIETEEDGNGQKTPVAPPSPLEGVLPLDFPAPPPPAKPKSKDERMADLAAAHDRAVASRQQALDGTATQPQPLFWGATLPGVKRYRASRADDPAFALAEYVCAELERRGVPFDWGHKHAGGQACYWLQEAESLVRLCHNDRGLIDQVLTEAFRGSLSIKSPASIQYLVSEIKRDRGNRGQVAAGVVEDTTVADDRLRGLLA